MVRCSYFSSFHKLIVVETQKKKIIATIVLIPVILTTKAIFIIFKNSGSTNVCYWNISENKLKNTFFKPADSLKNIWNLSDFRVANIWLITRQNLALKQKSETVLTFF